MPSKTKTPPPLSPLHAARLESARHTQAAVRARATRLAVGKTLAFETDTDALRAKVENGQRIDERGKREEKTEKAP